MIRNDDSLVDLLEECALCWVVAHRVDHLLDSGSVLLDDHCNLLLLHLDLLALVKVFNIAGLVLLEDFTFL